VDPPHARRLLPVLEDLLLSGSCSCSCCRAAAAPPSPPPPPPPAPPPPPPRPAAAAAADPRAFGPATPSSERNQHPTIFTAIEAALTPLLSSGTQMTCFTGTKAQILTLRTHHRTYRDSDRGGVLTPPTHTHTHTHMYIHDTTTYLTLARSVSFCP
jgi:hypothetical protein